MEKWSIGASFRGRWRAARARARSEHLTGRSEDRKVVWVASPGSWSVIVNGASRSREIRTPQSLPIFRSSCKKIREPWRGRARTLLGGAAALAGFALGVQLSVFVGLQHERGHARGAAVGAERDVHGV